MSSPGQIKVNFSEEEANSEAKLFEAIPTGEYKCAIVKIEPKKVKAEKPDGSKNENVGKPWWNVQLKVVEGDYAKRVLFAGIMLFDGALYSAAQLLRATGFGDSINSGSIPSPEKLLGKEVIVVVQRKQDAYAMKKDPGGPVIYKNDVRGFNAVGGASVSGNKASSSLLPG